jgi:hypothetical protein
VNLRFLSKFQFGGEVLPLATEAIGVAGWRLGSLYLDPSNETRSAILEAVVGAHARPQDVTGVKDQQLAVD